MSDTAPDGAPPRDGVPHEPDPGSEYVGSAAEPTSDEPSSEFTAEPTPDEVGAEPAAEPGQPPALEEPAIAPFEFADATSAAAAAEPATPLEPLESEGAEPDLAESEPVEPDVAESEAVEPDLAESEPVEPEPAPAPISYAAEPLAQPVGGPPSWLTAGLAAAAAILLLTVLVFGVLHLVASDNRTSKADDVRQAAVAAARQAVVNVTSFDYRNLPAQVKRVEQTSGGAFAKELTNTKSALVQEITSEQRVSSSRVVETAVAASSDTEVTVLLAVDELRKSKADPKGTTLRYRMQVRMAKQGDRWLLVELRPVT